MMMMRRESQSPTVAGVLTELCSAGAATGSDTACCAGLLACLLAAANGSISCLSHGPRWSSKFDRKKGTAVGPPPARHCPAQPPSRIGFARQSVTVCHCHFVTCHYYSFSPKTTAEQKRLVRRAVRDFTRPRNTARPIIIVIMINPSKEEEKEPSVLLQ